MCSSDTCTVPPRPVLKVCVNGWAAGWAAASAFIGDGRTAMGGSLIDAARVLREALLAPGLAMHTTPLDFSVGAANATAAGAGAVCCGGGSIVIVPGSGKILAVDKGW
jgi:hypothetical protein